RHVWRFHLLMRGHRRSDWTKRRLRRVAEHWQPRNQKARDEFGPEFHKFQYRRCRGTPPRLTVELVYRFTLLPPLLQMREECIGSNESCELGIGLLPPAPVIENQGRRPKETKAPQHCSVLCSVLRHIDAQ